MARLLADALASLDAPPHVIGDVDGIHVRDLVFDHRRAAPGVVFACVRGSHTDGHDFAVAAVAAGSTVLLAERLVGGLDEAVVQVIVADTRRAMAPLSACIHGDPSHVLTVVGVTGTNGKTTTTSMLADVLTALGSPCRTVGTLTGGQTTPTTPEAPALQAMLAGFVASGVASAAVEVSSHALVRNRIDGTRFAVACFTNLTQDHLEEHGTMEAYFAAKVSLFTQHEVGHAVVWVEDTYGERLITLLPAELPRTLVRYGDATDVWLEADGSSFTWRGARLHVPTPGRHNVANALIVAEAARALGHDVDAISVAFDAVRRVDGRFERVDAGQPFAIFVDYAHTPDGVEAALSAARELAHIGRVLVVLGAGGDRDATKRTPMGEVAARLADEVWLTSDNPRSENPEIILDAIEAGAASHPGGAVIHRQADRRTAITQAVAAARKGDVVLIAGKGHETYQEVAGVRHPFDDRAVARAALATAGHQEST